MSLTVKRIEEIEREGKRGRHHDGDGLYLQVHPAKKKRPPVLSWVLRYTLRGKERWLGLGSLKVSTAAEARQRARKARQLIFDGIDPVEQKLAQESVERAEAAKAEAARTTFRMAAQAFFDKNHIRWTNKVSHDQFMASLEMYAFPVIGDWAVADVGKEAVLEILDPIWESKLETAGRVRSRIESVLDFSEVRGWRSGQNPARWVGLLEHALPSKAEVRKAKPQKEHRALPVGEIAELMAAIRGRDGVAARAIEFVVLTAARTSEVTGATWDEIDLEEKIWRVPAYRMKSKREHVVPLSDEAIAVLQKSGEEGNPYVFANPRGGCLSNMAMTATMKRAKFLERTTIHGLRSTFRDWVGEVSTFPTVLAEHALAHAVGAKTERSYARGTMFLKRRKLMAAWAAFCAKPVAEVVPMTQKPGKIA